MDEGPFSHKTGAGDAAAGKNLRASGVSQAAILYDLAAVAGLDEL